MTNEEMDAQIQAQSGVICTPHEGAALAHYLTACRYCCLRHFMALERERCAKIAEEYALRIPEDEAHVAGTDIAKKIREDQAIQEMGT